MEKKSDTFQIIIKKKEEKKLEKKNCPKENRKFLSAMFLMLECSEMFPKMNFIKIVANNFLFVDEFFM